MAVPEDGDAFRHVAFFYRSEAEYLAEVSGFAGAALARGEPVLIAVPGCRFRPLRAALGAQAGQVIFADMTQAGRNPGRLIPAMHAFAGGRPGHPASVTIEPDWPARPEPELLEVARHEALTNLAFAGVPCQALCLYDATALPDWVLAMAEQTHPLLGRPGGARASPGYLGPGGIPRPCLEPLPEPPPGAAAVTYREDLQPVRVTMGRWAARACLPQDRTDDLVLATSELAANTLRHTHEPGELLVWQTPDELLCEIRDLGWITDPLAGRHPRHQDSVRGSGLWLVNQVCDLVETRTGPRGTATRMHMRLPAAQPRRAMQPAGA